MKNITASYLLNIKVKAIINTCKYFLLLCLVISLVEKWTIITWHITIFIAALGNSVGSVSDSWSGIMKSFLLSVSPFCSFKKECCQLLAKEYTLNTFYQGISRYIMLQIHAGSTDANHTLYKKMWGFCRGIMFLHLLLLLLLLLLLHNIDRGCLRQFLQTPTTYVWTKKIVTTEK